MLCALCLKIYPVESKDAGQTNLIRHHACFDDLLRSAEIGCSLCQLLRPYVEKCLQRQRNIQRGTEPRTANDRYGWTKVDPWAQSDRLVYDAGDGWIYVDCGDYYELSTFNVFYPGVEVIEKERLKKQKIDQENPITAKDLDSTDSWQYNHYFDCHDVFPGLFSSHTPELGPEQIWIECTYQSGSTSISLEGGEREDRSTFTVSAGSISLSPPSQYSKMKYWYEDMQICSLQQLACRVPSLWRWRKINLNVPDHKFEYPKFEFYASETCDSLERWSGVVAKPIAAQAGSPEAFQTLENWLQYCLSRHPLCQPSASIELPRRVIDMGYEENGWSPRLYVPDPSDEIKDTRYAILSHCWGNAIPSSSKLFHANLQEMRKHLDTNLIAQNFRDTIFVTRSLGIRFLWIDALCILQDSKEDWAAEATKMSQYYSNSYLCISAASASHAQAGMLHHRDLASNKADLEGAASGLSVRPMASNVKNLLTEPSFLQQRPQLASQPLNTRSWSFQERLLSPRIVHYLDQQMAWQCRMCLLGEDGQIGEDYSSDALKKLGSLYKGPVDLSLGVPLRHITACNEDELGRDLEFKSAAPVNGITGVKYSLDEALLDIKWYSLLEYYTKRQLTYATDLLPGLSALAQQTQALTGAEYIGGLWSLRGEIPVRSLLWYLDTPSVRANNGSPSWAWSSVLGPVQHCCLWMIRFDHPGALLTTSIETQNAPTVRRAENSDVGKAAKPRLRFAGTVRRKITYEHTDSAIQFLNIKTHLATSNPFGQLNGATLTISALVCSYAGSSQYTFAAERLHGSDSFDMIDFLDTSEADPYLKGDCFLVSVAEFRDNVDGSLQPGNRAKDQRRFLILRRVYDEDPGHVERIGTARLWPKDGTGSLVEYRCAYTEQNGWSRKILTIL